MAYRQGKPATEKITEKVGAGKSNIMRKNTIEEICNNQNHGYLELDQSTGRIDDTKL